MTEKLHPADAADIEKIAQAAAFNVHLRVGPNEKINRRAETLAAAVRIADRLGKTAGGKRPIIYAITADKMTVHVPARIVAQARREAAAGARKAEKPAKAAETERKPAGKRAAILEAAQAGKLPPVPDFSAPTHARFRKKLDEVVAMAKAGDVKGLKDFHINPVSTSPKAIMRYRDLAIVALEAKRSAA